MTNHMLYVNGVQQPSEPLTMDCSSSFGADRGYETSFVPLRQRHFFYYACPQPILQNFLIFSPQRASFLLAFLSCFLAFSSRGGNSTVLEDVLLSREVSPHTGLPPSLVQCQESMFALPSPYLPCLSCIEDPESRERLIPIVYSRVHSEQT